MPAALDGSFEDSLQDASIPVSGGDMFFMYTDGVTEAKDREGRHFGFQRLVASLQRMTLQSEDHSATGVSKALMAELEDYTGFEGLVDDISFIVARAVVETPPTTDSGLGQISAAPDQTS